MAAAGAKTDFDVARWSAGLVPLIERKRVTLAIHAKNKAGQCRWIDEDYTSAHSPALQSVPTHNTHG